MAARRLEAVLFDLDGTLIDTAPDLVGTLESLCRDAGRPPPPYPAARAAVTNGARGLIELGFPGIDEAALETRYRLFLERYEERVARESRLFDGVGPVLDAIEAAPMPWGIVTNKPIGLTRKLLDALELAARSACTLGADSLPERKPSPLPMFTAAQRMGVAPAHCAYVGDNRRDVEAGRAAGMVTVAVGWGYVVDGDDPADWGADRICRRPEELLEVLALDPAEEARTCSG